MSEPEKENADNGTLTPEPYVDEHGFRHFLGEKIKEGGQGAVYRTSDDHLALKLINAANKSDKTGKSNKSDKSIKSDKPEKNLKLREQLQKIRLLPLPPRIPISMPLAVLRDKPGYIMRLLNDMKPFSHFDLNGKTKAELRLQTLPDWLFTYTTTDKNFALLLFHYAKTGSTGRRLYSLAKFASILARIHSAGLVYGDISPDNVFFGEREVWLIDVDNLCYEYINSGKNLITAGYGAPEIVRGQDHARPRTDCWAFAVLAFQTLALCHPLKGKKVYVPDNDNYGWDADPAEDGGPVDLDERAYAGFFPFIDDNDDDSNASVNGNLPREYVATPEINMLFQETFGAGRAQPHRRPSMAFWALELTRASDKSLYCPNCHMSYFPDNNICPYCDTKRPAFLRVKTPRWEIIISAEKKEFMLPRRLFHPFSFENNDDTEYEAILDFSGKSVKPVRGTADSFPKDLRFDYVEAVK